MDKRDKGYTLYKKGLSCTEISKKLDVSINTVKSWRKRYWTQGADAPAKRPLHPENPPAAPDPETRPKQGAPPGNVNAVGAGAPKGNRNAVKHGGWSELMFRSWTEEHRQLLDACDEDVDAEELLINELKLLTARCDDKLVLFGNERMLSGKSCLYGITQGSITLGNAVLESSDRVLFQYIGSNAAYLLHRESIGSGISCRK